MITKRQKECEKKEALLNYIMSESSLAKDWLTKEECNIWKNL